MLALSLGLHLALVTMPQLSWLSARQSSGQGCTDGSRTCWDNAVEATRGGAVGEGVLGVATGLVGVSAMRYGAWLMAQQQAASGEKVSNIE